MDKKIFIERLTETENLTNELEDPDAKWLLAWGIKHLDDALQDFDDENTASAKVTALMAILRRTNRLVGNRRNVDAAILESEQDALEELFIQAFGWKEIYLREDLSRSANLFRLMTSREALEFVLGNQPIMPGKPDDRTPPDL